MNQNLKTILLTGGTGYLGSRLAERLLAENYRVLLLKRSFSRLDRVEQVASQVNMFNIDEQPISQLFEQENIDIIVHCATDYGRKNSDSLQIVNANLILPLELIQLASKKNVRCFVNTDTILDKRVNDYSLSKKQFRDWLFVFSKKMTCINVALEHFYGPGDDTTKFISNIINSVLRNADSIDLTLGQQERDFIFIDDTIEAFAKIIERSDGYNNGFFDFEVGTGKSYPIRHVVERIKQIAGNTRTVLNFGAIPYRDNEVMSCKSNNESLKMIGWNYRYSLDEGLLKTIEYEKELLS